MVLVDPLNLILEILLSLIISYTVSALSDLLYCCVAALAACHYLPQMREKIFTVLYKVLLNMFVTVNLAMTVVGH